MARLISIFGSLILLLTSPTTLATWNNPYPNDATTANTLYTAFTERPKHLDPARSFAANEWVMISQIYEPPLQYHYFKRPYALIPLLATALPEMAYFNEAGEPVSENKREAIAYTEYTLRIRPGTCFQPHPAFAKDEQETYRYHQLDSKTAAKMNGIADFKEKESRELTAADFVYQIKRLGDPRLDVPIFGIMSEHIAGLKAFSQQISEHNDEHWLDLRTIPLSGVTEIDRYTYRIRINGFYPQFKYWLAMPFFSPMAWEVDKFFSQPKLQAKNLSLDWYPVGTGPYQLIKNNPNQEIILTRNPNFRGEAYPTEHVPPTFAHLKGQRMPFIDKIQFTLEKENIPYWSKFLQGYYDMSGISANSFDQALQTGASGGLTLSPELEAQGIQLQTNVMPSTFYWGFNMEDPVVGGLGPKQRALRQAISIALDLDEYVEIFMNGRGMVAQSPIPPGIFGHVRGPSGVNPIVYEWAPHDEAYQRLPLAKAEQLMIEAGYPDGQDLATGEPLVLYFDTVASSGPDGQARLAWMRKQFKKIGINLVIRATQYNRFQEKINQGQAQIFQYGWNADYPDPENFMFLLYGPNKSAKYGGLNSANYDNPEYDRLFDLMRDMPDGPERMAIIDKMKAIITQDAPWIWGVHPKQYSLNHQWLGPLYPNAITKNTLKYIKLDAEARAKRRHEWNQPILWPIIIAVVMLLIITLPAFIKYYKKEREEGI